LCVDFTKREQPWLKGLAMVDLARFWGLDLPPVSKFIRLASGYTLREFPTIKRATCSRRAPSARD
jgi:hypothetical protein